MDQNGISIEQIFIPITQNIISIHQNDITIDWNSIRLIEVAFRSGPGLKFYILYCMDWDLLENTSFSHLIGIFLPWPW